MHTWSFRAAIVAVLCAAALIGAGIGRPAGATPVRAAAPNAFGGPLERHAHVRPIARDLTQSSASLARVPCAAASPGRTCFAASR